MDRTLLLRTLRLCKPYIGSVVAAALLIALRVATELSAPLVYRHIIDVAIVKSNIASIVVGAAVYTLLSSGAGALGALYTYVLTRAGLDMISALRARLVGTVLRWPLTQWDSVSTGQVQARVISDPQSLQNLLTDTVPSLVRNLMVLPTAMAALLMLDWRLALPCMVLVPAYVVPAKCCGSWTRSAWQRVAETRETLFKVVQDALQGVRLIKALANEAGHVEHLRPFDREFTGAYLSAAVVGRVYGVAVTTVSLIPVGLILGWGGILVARGRTTIGTIVAAATYVQQLYAALSVLPGLYVQGKQFGVFLKRTMEYLDVPTEENGSARPDLRSNCDIVLSDVYLAYGNRVALDSVSLHVGTGKTVAIVGPSGSGKSSIAMLILGMYRPLRGRVTVGGVDLGECDLNWLRRHVGVVAQDTFLFTGTIYDNIAYSKVDATMDDVVRVAKAARIHEFIIGLPQGYHTPCGERGVQLSGGQRQRIAIARTLLQDPCLLILDEATSGLDMRAEAELTATLAELMSQRTTLIISHRPSIIATAEYVYVLSSGRVVGEGSPSELRASTASLSSAFVSPWHSPLEQVERR